VLPSGKKEYKVGWPLHRWDDWWLWFIEDYKNYYCVPCLEQRTIHVGCDSAWYNLWC
jgi:hypothetical protein